MILGVLVSPSCMHTPTALPMPEPPKPLSIELKLHGVVGAATCIHQYPYPQLEVIGKNEDGTQVHSTTYFRDGRPRFKRGTIENGALEVGVNHGQISAFMLFIPPVNDFDLLGTELKFQARMRNNPAVSTTLEWVPSFDCPSVVALRGADGVGGPYGGNGGNGENGPEVDVILTYLDLDQNGSKLALAKVKSTYTGALLGYYIFSPKHGIRFDVSGGHGGAAGGAYNVESIQTGRMGGGMHRQGPRVSTAVMPGGAAGRSGRSGNVHLSVDERFPSLAQSVAVTRGSGASLASPLPQSSTLVAPSVAFREEFVAGLPVQPVDDTPGPDSQAPPPDSE